MRSLAIVVVLLAGAAAPARAASWEDTTFAAYFNVATSEVSNVHKIMLPEHLPATDLLVGRVHGVSQAIVMRCGGDDGRCTWVGHAIRLDPDSQTDLVGVVDLAGTPGDVVSLARFQSGATAPALVLRARPDGKVKGDETESIAVISLFGDSAGTRVFGGAVRDGDSGYVTAGDYKLVAGKGKVLDLVGSVRTEKRMTRCLVKPVETHYVFDGHTYAASTHPEGHSGCG